MVLKTLSIVVLSHNEEKNLTINKRKIIEILNIFQNISKCNIILEEDGSTDKTREIILKLSNNNNYISHKFNDDKLGKGGGMIFATKDITSDYILITDADMPIDIEDYINLYNNILKGFDIVIANRYHKYSKKDIPIIRQIFSRIFNLFVRIIFLINIEDTQCGVKIFKRKSLKRIYPIYGKHYIMDIEMLYRAKREKMQIREISVNYKHSSDTNFSIIHDGLKMLLDMIYLRYKLTIIDYNGTPEKSNDLSVFI